MLSYMMLTELIRSMERDKPNSMALRTASSRDPEPMVSGNMGPESMNETAIINRDEVVSDTLTTGVSEIRGRT